MATLGIFSIYLIYEFGFAFIPPLIGALIGFISIRFPKIYLYHDRFRILKKCLIDIFTEDDTFEYKNLKNVEFSEGFTDKNHIIVLILLSLSGATTSGGNSKADQMIINAIDDKTTIVNRFGKKSEFIKTIELVKNYIMEADNK
ncbi:MAG: hypothetical protein P1P88_20590 [Bacteroidales bacterium]|nr:hypothetical protein [Bacteroidales bacterium]